MPSSEHRKALGRRAHRVPRAERGATAAEHTPLDVYWRARQPDEALRASIEQRLGRRLGKFALVVTRVLVWFEDVNGPRRGVDTQCTIEVLLSGLPSVVTQGRSTSERVAFQYAARRSERAVRERLERAQRSIGRQENVSSPPGERPDEPLDSLIGRREGRGPANLEAALARPEKLRRDEPVDTAQPGTSATDRRAGGPFTARRNTKRRTRGMVATLEDSLRARPSRKSSRRSANRAKHATPMTRREVARTTSPKARALRARAFLRGKLLSWRR